MPYIDVHAHLDFPDFKDELDSVMQKCKEKKVSVVVNGVNPASNRRVLELAEKYNLIKPALGFYPTDVVEESEEVFDAELDFIKKSKCVGFGEIGMDFKYGKSQEDQKKQEGAFWRFIELSEKSKKPLIIHSRKAELKVLEMLESSGVKKPVLHMFSGKKKLVERAADNGYFFSVPVIVNKLEQFQHLVDYTNINQLLTETDSPYLGPTPSVKNYPWNVSIAIKKIAEIKGFEEVEVENNIFMNYQRLF
ncbi:MAG: TatD family hydrolase [Candidatus Woesearchaeota archaeon]